MFCCTNVDSFKEGEATINKTTANINYAVNTEELLKTFIIWYNYTYNNIKLSDDFVGLNADSIIIKKSDFLHQLATGKFVPIKVIKRDNTNYYKLYKLKNPDPNIVRTVTEMALTETSYYAMEEKELPAYDFIDLNGKSYSNTIPKYAIDQPRIAFTY